MENQEIQLSVSEFIDLSNQVLDGAFPNVVLTGEVSSFKINQGKFVFFDLKDDESTVSCFMMLFSLRHPIEDGMTVAIHAKPKLTKWGKFSLTVQRVRPVGEGSIKKSYEILKSKLTKEGLFATEKKRQLPEMPKNIGVISSVQAAGYADFIKIIGDRWGGMLVDVAQVQVQGDVASEQIIGAINHFNQQSVLPEIIVIIRGGGSADDLSVFNDERLTRAVASSRIPILTGIGHETDLSLVDMAADVAASTPSNAAEIIVPDKNDTIDKVADRMRYIVHKTLGSVDGILAETKNCLDRAVDDLTTRYDEYVSQLGLIEGKLEAYNPSSILERGYVILRGDQKVGEQIGLETAKNYIKAEVLHVKSK
jgi:exodeoxyribonuclease VII large subunit